MKDIETTIWEYAEEMTSSISSVNGRPTVIALNEGGFNRTEVDLGDIIEWVVEHRFYLKTKYTNIFYGLEGR